MGRSIKRCAECRLRNRRCCGQVGCLKRGNVSSESLSGGIGSNPAGRPLVSIAPVVDKPHVTQSLSSLSATNFATVSGPSLGQTQSQSSVSNYHGKGKPHQYTDVSLASSNVNNSSALNLNSSESSATSLQSTLDSASVADVYSTPNTPRTVLEYRATHASISGSVSGASAVGNNMVNATNVKLQGQGQTNQNITSQSSFATSATNGASSLLQRNDSGGQQQRRRQRAVTDDVVQYYRTDGVPVIGIMRTDNGVVSSVGGGAYSNNSQGNKHVADINSKCTDTGNKLNTDALPCSGSPSSNDNVTDVVLREQLERLGKLREKTEKAERTLMDMQLQKQKEEKRAKMQRLESQQMESQQQIYRQQSQASVQQARAQTAPHAPQGYYATAPNAYHPQYNYYAVPQHPGYQAIPQHPGYQALPVAQQSQQQQQQQGNNNETEDNISNSNGSLYTGYDDAGNPKRSRSRSISPVSNTSLLHAKLINNRDFDPAASQEYITPVTASTAAAAATLQQQYQRQPKHEMQEQSSWRGSNDTTDETNWRNISHSSVPATINTSGDRVGNESENDNESKNQQQQQLQQQQQQQSQHTVTYVTAAPGGGIPFNAAPTYYIAPPGMTGMPAEYLVAPNYGAYAYPYPYAYPAPGYAPIYYQPQDLRQSQRQSQSQQPGQPVQQQPSGGNSGVTTSSTMYTEAIDDGDGSGGVTVSQHSPHTPNTVTHDTHVAHEVKSNDVNKQSGGGGAGGFGRRMSTSEVAMTMTAPMYAQHAAASHYAAYGPPPPPQQGPQFQVDAHQISPPVLIMDKHPSSY